MDVLETQRKGKTMATETCDNTTHPTSVRLWVWINDSPVYLTLHDGAPVHHRDSSPHDEGYESRYQSWDYDRAEGIVRRESGRSGYDCDGRYSNDWEAHCPIANLQTNQEVVGVGSDGQLLVRTPEEGGALFPEWETGEHRCRDYAAEAMGY